MHRPIRALLFDLDDTLNDRARSWRKFVDLLLHPSVDKLGACQVVEVYNTILAADRGGYRAKDEFFAELVDALPWRSLPSAEELENLWRAEFPRCMVARDGAIDLLQHLRSLGYRLSIVTNGRAAMQQAKIEFLGLGRLVDAVIISEAAGVKKPDRKIFEIALTSIGARVDETIFIGDDPERDIVGAAKAGMRTVWLKLGRDWPEELPRPDHIIAGFEAIEQIILQGT